MTKLVIGLVSFGAGFAAGVMAYGLMGIRDYVREKVDNALTDIDFEDYVKRNENAQDQYPESYGGPSFFDDEPERKDKEVETSDVRFNPEDIDPVNYRRFFAQNGDDKGGDIPSEADIFNEFHEENKNKQPELISEEVCDMFPALYDRRTIYVYSYDYTWTDDQNNVVDEDIIVGDRLKASDDLYDLLNNARVVYVANYSHDTIYDIHLIDTDCVFEDYIEEMR